MVDRDLADKCRKWVKEYAAQDSPPRVAQHQNDRPYNRSSQTKSPSPKNSRNYQSSQISRPLPGYNQNYWGSQRSQVPVKGLLITGLLIASGLIGCYIASRTAQNSPAKSATKTTNVHYVQRLPPQNKKLENRLSSTNADKNKAAIKYTEPAESYYKSAKAWMERGQYYYADQKIDEALYHDPHNVKYNTLKAEIAVRAKVKDFCDRPKLKHKLREAKEDLGDKLRQIFDR